MLLCLDVIDPSDDDPTVSKFLLYCMNSSIGEQKKIIQLLHCAWDLPDVTERGPSHMGPWNRNKKRSFLTSEPIKTADRRILPTRLADILKIIQEIEISGEAREDDYYCRKDVHVLLYRCVFVCDVRPVPTHFVDRKFGAGVRVYFLIERSIALSLLMTRNMQVRSIIENIRSVIPKFHGRQSFHSGFLMQLSVITKERWSVLSKPSTSLI